MACKKCQNIVKSNNCECKKDIPKCTCECKKVENKPKKKKICYKKPCGCQLKPCKCEHDEHHKPCKCKENGYHKPCKCEDHKHEDCGKNKGCKKYIEETYDIIEELRDEENRVGAELKSALNNQKQAKHAIIEAEKELDKVPEEILNVQEELFGLIEELGCITKDIEKVFNYLDIAKAEQNKAIKDIEKAQSKESKIDDLIDDLEDAFEDTVECLEKKCEKPHPPHKPCEHKKPCKWEDECDCDCC